NMKGLQLLNGFFWVLLIALTSACKSDKYSRVFSPVNLESEFFKIKAGKDTSFTSRQGVVIEIPAQTFFRREPNGIVTLEVKIALDVEDMILGGLSTVDSSGTLLESAGMVFINAEPKQPINPDFPIRIKIPAQRLNPAMQVFRLHDEKNPAAGWVESSALANAGAIAATEKGQASAGPATDSVVAPVKFYELEFREFGWVNVDYFPEDMVGVDPFEISLEKPELAGFVEIIVVFNRRKIVVMTEPDKLIYRLMGSRGKPKIRLPLGEVVQIIGSGKSADGKYWFGVMDAKIRETNQYTLEFRQSTADALYRFVKVPSHLNMPSRSQ
ncbi:MAG TPA: hypothetical protein PK228_07980, partial [Saprospiraceae bacterium]|nr:hypothetical protein [Saprospiraceae bacterium]